MLAQEGGQAGRIELQVGRRYDAFLRRAYGAADAAIVACAAQHGVRRQQRRIEQGRQRLGRQGADEGEALPQQIHMVFATLDAAQTLLAQCQLTVDIDVTDLFDSEFLQQGQARHAMVGWRRRVHDGAQGQLLATDEGGQARHERGDGIDDDATGAGSVAEQPGALAIDAELDYAVLRAVLRRWRQRRRQQTAAAQRFAAALDARAGGRYRRRIDQGAERQTDGRAGTPLRHVHRFEHIAGESFGGGTGAARADAHARRVEQVEQFLRRQARHGKIERGRQRQVKRHIEHDAGESALQACHQLRAESDQLRVAAEGLAIVERGQHGAQGGDAGHVFRARAQARFLAAAHHQRCKWRTGAHIQHADALWRIQLVAGERRVIDARGGQVQFQLAQRLHAIDHPVGIRAAFLQQLRDGGQVADDARFIIRRHRAQHGRVADQRVERLQIVAPVCIDGQLAHFQVQTQ